MALSSCAIIVCSRCRDPRTGAPAAASLLPNLAGGPLPDCFEVDTAACMAGCKRPLAVAFHGEGKASFLFGDIDPILDVDALIDFANLYQSLPDGWCNEARRPHGLRGKTLARIPAARLAAS